MTNSKYSYLIFSIFVLLIYSENLLSQSERRFIRSGNDLYEKASKDTSSSDTLIYSKAEVEYLKALEENLDSYEASFNLGNTYFKEQKFEKAAEQFKVLAHKTDDKTQLGEVYHNLGNSLLAGGQLEPSIEAYKNALRNTPNDTTTKYNLAVAQKMLKEAEQQQCENPEKQEGENQENQEQQDQQQEQQEQNQKQEQEQKEEQQQQSQEQDKEQEGEEKQMHQISKEDAERLLQALEQDEKNLQEKLKKEKAKARKIRIEKDW